MQVATLFRESATLLGASMEAGGVNTGGQEAGGPGVMSPVLGMGMPHEANTAAVAFNLPGTNKYKIPVDVSLLNDRNMKMEPQDDGYETGADILLSNTNNQNSIKCESMEDPYSFIDEEPMSMIQREQNAHMPCQTTVVPAPNPMTNPLENTPKKRGRKKKIKTEPGMEFSMGISCDLKPKIKERKKHDRFNGMPEEEVSKRTLPDHLANNLDIIIIGINPGLFAAYKGHHYAGPGNHFWKCLYLSGLTPEQMTADEDYKLLQVGIGFTNMVQRPTKGSADLTRKEIKEGCQILLDKLQRFKPKIAVFNGKLIYEVFSGKKDFAFGRQPDMVDGTNTYMWVMPSSSARCAQLPRAADKVPFYAALKKFRDYLNGIVTSIDESEVVFTDARLKNCCESEIKDSSVYSMELMDISNAVVKKDEIIPCKKKRGRPKKIKVEGEEPAKPVNVCKTTQSASNCDFPKKKRGRPKKIKCDDSDISMQDRNTHTPISKCFSSPSPIQSPTSFYHMNPQMTSPNGGSNMYGGMPLSHQPYSQSPRPHSQPFTHSDLSSEISAAISSDQLGSPAPTSPSLGPPDFDPPTSMPTDDAIECRFSSPAPSTTSEQPSSAAQVSSGPPYPTYHHTFGPDADAAVAHNYLPPQTPHSVQRPGSVSDYKVEDMSTKSLSGLESLVDQIPNIADGEMPHNVEAINAENGEQYHSNMYPNYGTPNRLVSPGSPATRSYSSYVTNGGYTSLPSIVSSSNPFSVSNLTSSYCGSNSSDGCSSPNSVYTPNMFVDHHQHSMVGLPPPPPPATFAGYGSQGYTTGNGSYPPPTLHVPSPNYPPPPPPYYNATPYPHPSGAPGMPTSPAAYLHNHLFDRIKHPDLGYGSF